LMFLVLFLSPTLHL